MVKGRISFIILTYKSFKGIYDTLESVFIQDYPDIEIIISDDGSPDADEELDKIELFIETKKTVNISNVIIRRGKENLGTVKNINEAIKLSTGEYIKDIGADDTLAEKDVLSKYKRFLDDNGLLICCSKLLGIKDNGERVYKLASCADDYDVLEKMSPFELRNRLFQRNCLPAPAIFVKRELYERYGLYPEEYRLIEDYPYWLRLCAKGVKIGFLDERLVEYKLSGVSSAGHYSEMFMKDLKLIYENEIFPYDKRYGIFQKIYNQFKRDGLSTYMAKAKWNEYSTGKKFRVGLRYFPFFLYIKLFMK